MERRAANDAASHAQRVLGLAIEHAYVVFAPLRIGRSMTVRRRDVTTADVAALSGPIRSVTAAAIDRWLPHAVTTWGTDRDLRALLPRVFELLTAGLLATPPEVLLAKLGHADRKRWPLEERTAVELVLRALWNATLVEHPSPMGIQTGRLLVGLAELGDPLRPHLDDWDAARGDPATRRAAEQHRRDLELHISSLDRRGFGVPDLFWSARQAAAQELTAWLAAERRR